MGALHLTHSRRHQDRSAIHNEREPGIADAEVVQLSLLPYRVEVVSAKVESSFPRRRLSWAYRGLGLWGRLAAQVPRSVDFSLFPLLERLRAEFLLPCAERGLHFAVVAQDVRVYGDPFLLESILRYLITNAIRFTPEGCIRVCLRRENQYWRIEVWDTGVGISKQQQQSIFFEDNPFETSIPAVTVPMSLPSVARLCRQLGLPLHLRSKPGLGTLFSVDVPIAAGRAPVFLPDLTGIAVESFSDSLVLLVEEKNPANHLLAAWLRTWGCTVFVAHSGNEALQCLQGLSKGPDLIISDYRLDTDETGVDVIQRLHQHFNAPIPSLLLAGSSVSDGSKVARSGAFPVLQKPLQPQRVHAAIARLLGVSLLSRA